MECIEGIIITLGVIALCGTLTAASAASMKYLPGYLLSVLMTIVGIVSSLGIIQSLFKK